MSATAQRERKLQPIFTAYDTGNFRACLKLCAKKDVSAWDQVRVMRALCLERLGQHAEAAEAAALVKDSKPYDRDVVSMLAHAYKVLGSQQDAVECWENAAAAAPADEEFARQLALGYLRTGAHAKLQQVSTRTYKTQKSPEYLYWIVVALILQVKAGAPKTLGAIAERMARKALDERRAQGAPVCGEELRLVAAIHDLVGDRASAKTKEAFAAFGGACVPPWSRIVASAAAAAAAAAALPPPPPSHPPPRLPRPDPAAGRRRPPDGRGARHPRRVVAGAGAGLLAHDAGHRAPRARGCPPVRPGAVAGRPFPAGGPPAVPPGPVVQPRQLRSRGARPRARRARRRRLARDRPA